MAVSNRATRRSAADVRHATTYPTERLVQSAPFLAAPPPRFFNSARRREVPLETARRNPTSECGTTSTVPRQGGTLAFVFRMPGNYQRAYKTTSNATPQPTPDFPRGA